MTAIPEFRLRNVHYAKSLSRFLSTALMIVS
jgi:hypothetical protein